MGLLNYLFKDKEDIAKEIGIDAETRIKVWKEYLDSYDKKYGLAANLLKSAGSMQIVQDIEILIPKELVDIEKEKKNEKEILKDFKMLTSTKWSNRIVDLKDVIIDEKESESIYEILKRLFRLLKTELHTIKIIKQNPKKYEDYSHYLCVLIITAEFKINTLFGHILVKEKHKDTQELVHKIIRGEHISKEIETEERKLVKKFRAIMGEESHHELRQLAHIIYEELLKYMVHFANDMPAEQRLSEFVNNDKILSDIIRKYHPRFSKEKIQAIIKAFRWVFEHGNI